VTGGVGKTTFFTPLPGWKDVDLVGHLSTRFACPMVWITGRRRPAGTSIGSLREAREMLDFCATPDITAEAEIIKVDHAFSGFRDRGRRDRRRARREVP
jgi:D-arabinose 1-dehydrogenase-like Zn-dependent alcohol dehydrogenase